MSAGPPVRAWLASSSRCRAARLARSLRPGALLALFGAIGFGATGGEARAQEAPPPVAAVTSGLARVEPGGFPTLSVLIRNADPAAAATRVEVLSPAGWAVVGPGSFDIHLAAGDSARVPVTLAVPPDAPAGRAPALSLRLVDRGGSTIAETLHEVLVDRVRRPEIRLLDSTWPALAGKTARVRYAVRNAGNGPDTLELRAAADPGWKLRGPSRTLELGAGESIEGEIEVPTPSGLEPGNRTRIALEVRAGDRVAGAEAFLVVEEPRGRTGTTRSSLATTVAGLASGSGTPGVMDQIRVVSRGTVGADWLVDLRYQDRLGPRRLMTGPLSYGPPLLVLRASRPGIETALGDLDSRFSDLTGSYLFGYGADLALEGDAGRLRVLAARPGRLRPTGTAESGRLLGFEIGRAVGPLELVARATDLERSFDPFGGSSRLRAGTLEASGAGPLGSRLTGEVGIRSGARGDGSGSSGLAWSARLERADPGRAFHLGYVHAPIDMPAYGPSGDELSGAANLALSPRVLAIATLRRASQAGGATFGFESSAWSVGPRVALTRALSGLVSLEGTSTELAGGAAFRDRERVARLGGDGLFGPLQVSASLAAGGRALGDAPFRTLLVHDLRLQLNTARGVLWAAKRGRETAGGSPLDVASVSVGASGVRVWHGLVAEGEITREVHSLGDNDRLRVRAGIATPLAGGFDLRAVTERQPFNRFLYGREWTLGVELSRSFGLPLPFPVGTRLEGFVFRDLDGDGARDPGEPPLSGVRISLGDREVLSDAKGGFAIGNLRPGRSDLTVDVATLPAGEGAVPPRPVALRSGEGRRVEIPVQAYGAVEGLVFEDESGNGAREPGEPPGRALTIELDGAGGTTQTVVSDSVGGFRFGSVLPGSYTVRVFRAGRAQPPQTVRVESGRVSRIELPVPSSSAPVILTFDGATDPEESSRPEDRPRASPAGGR